ncbi:MAG: hypothetical protein KAG64_03455 [Bacteroidales bacterium]|nr:hypothetical protein [Bacteroidales bacterium]
MRIKLIVIFLFSTIVLSAQGILRYEGSFSNAENEVGTANYSYYKNANSGEHVKHGPFRYRVKIKNTKMRIYRNITGEYKSGFKDGQWEYLYTTKDKRGNDGYYYSYNVNLLANYESGWPNGEWFYTATIKRRQNMVERGETKWLPYEEVESTKMKLHFNHGVMVDSIWKKGMQSSFSLYADKEGFMLGSFELRTDTSYLKVSFKDGFVVKSNNANNDVYIQNDHYSYYSKNKKDLISKGVNVDTTTLTFYSTIFNNTVYNDKFFNYKFIDGDRMVSFVGSRKRMQVRYMGLYKRGLIVYISPEEQRKIQGVFSYRISVARKVEACEKLYKNSNNDIKIRKKLEQLKSIEGMLNKYTCLVQKYKSNVTPKEVADASKPCKSNIVINTSGTRIQILDTILSKSKALKSRADAIKCN